MTLYGSYFIANGTIDNHGILQWSNMKHGKLVPIQYQTASAANVGFWSKTAHLAERFFAGALGTAIPFAIATGFNYYSSGTLPTESKKLYELGLYTASLGFASAVATSQPMEALTRGMQFGSVAQITSALGGVGEGKAWDHAAHAYEATSEKVQIATGVVTASISSAYEKTKNTMSDAGNQASTSIGNAWQGLKSWSHDHVYKPVCDMSNNQIRSALHCPAQDETVTSTGSSMASTTVTSTGSSMASPTVTSTGSSMASPTGSPIASTTVPPKVTSTGSSMASNGGSDLGTRASQELRQIPEKISQN